MICQFCKMEFLIVGIDLLESQDSKGMQLLPAGTHLHGVGYITQQAMRKNVMTVRITGPDRRLLCVTYILLKSIPFACHLSKHIEQEFATEDRGGLHQFFYLVRKLIEPCYQQCANIPRQEGVANALYWLPSIRAHFDQIFLLQIADNLFNEIRITFRAIRNKMHEIERRNATQ